MKSYLKVLLTASAIGITAVATSAHAANLKMLTA